MDVRDLAAALDAIAPVRYAEPWDNVGLLVGDSSAPVTRVLLAIDYTPAVAAEALAGGHDAVVAYHPPIFKDLKRVLAGSVVWDAVRRGVAIYSPHTALDIAPGGTNDVLADAVGLTERAPLRALPGRGGVATEQGGSRASLRARGAPTSLTSRADGLAPSTIFGGVM